MSAPALSDSVVLPEQRVQLIEAARRNGAIGTPLPEHCVEIERPPYRPGEGTARVMLASETFKRHMTDEGWQLQIGLEKAGYQLWGRYLPPHDKTDVPYIIGDANPHTIIVQDKREWDPTMPGCFDKSIQFHHLEALQRPDLFKVTIIKDAHQHPGYHRNFHQQIEAHAWIVYYHPTVVKHLAPWVRPTDLIRTYHSLDREVVPEFTAERPLRALVSGALDAGNGVYDLRRRIVQRCVATYLPHPGYGANGCHTPAYLQMLSHYKVSICTTSIFGYALRKIIESTAAGCVVVTDLPEYDRLPEIDGNLIRIPWGMSLTDIKERIDAAVADYDAERQRHFAERAQAFYDWRAVGQRLADAIERNRTQAQEV